VQTAYEGRFDRYGRRVCSCYGYHFPHRKGGGACEHSKTCEIHLARRTKDPVLILDALVNYAFDNPGKTYVGTDCPF
jgi:hypothetical protein